MEKVYDAAVVGGGIAGYSAALTCKSLRLDCLWLGEAGFGDKLKNAEYVRNYPALLGDGKLFAARLEEQAAAEGVSLTQARIDGIYALGDKFCLTEKDKTYYARTVILATGTESRASVKGEREFLGRGVSYCAVCDGALYRGKKIAAVVASEKFAEEAEYLAGFAETVYAFCLYPAPKFRARNIVAVSRTPRLLEGKERIEAVVTETEKYPVSGVFFLKNSAPPEALAGGLKIEDGHVATGRDLSTNIAGLFAAGDITGRPYQYVKAAGEGCSAAYSALAYLKKHLPKSFTESA